MVRASKLADRIDLGLEKEYNPVEVFVDSEKSDADNFGDANDLGDYFQSTTDLTQPPVDPSLAIHQLKAGVNKEDILDKLFIPCVGNSSI